jgi:DNA modification methylase
VTDANDIPIAAAHGRPLLTWVGKRPLRRVTAFPAQHSATFDPAPGPPPDAAWTDWPDSYPPGGLLFHGDNKEVLAHLLAHGFRGRVNLIYIDPPFASGADYVRKVQLRGVTRAARIDGADYSLGEQVQYTDIWSNDSYLQFMYERLLLLRELLAETGSIYLHCDYRQSHHLRCLMDEVFGAEHLQNEIIWFYPRGGDSTRQFNRKHDTILYYTKGDTWTFNYHDVVIPYTPEQLARFDQEDAHGRFYWNVNPRGERVKTYLRKSGIGEYDVWNIAINAAQIQQIGYPTLKPEALLERIIRASSNPGDLLLDCFLGSGTTAAVAQKLNRRWIGSDINRGAIQTTVKRLQPIIAAQLAGDEAPVTRSFTVQRVNTYDLALPHGEAITLVCRHLGVERNRADSFFDGMLGQRLVKIIPFDHPLGLRDLDELQRELAARPDETRDIALVCLGQELATLVWLEEWHRLRATGPNRIEVIELRSDARYGTFIAHQPATARVSIERRDGRIRVVISDFISPTIITRLELDQTPVRASIPDWRAMVDAVMIDSAYDGRVFNITHCDLPARRQDLVSGSYDLPAPADRTTVAVKIIDMLGEEVLVVAIV